jgi:Sec-independent protein translocase protein TatA
VHTVTVVAFAALCLFGTSSLVLADDALKSETGHMKDEMKAGKDTMKAQDNAMESEMRAKKGGKKGPIMQHREKMKAKRHEMMDKMKTHKDAAMANPPAPVTTPAPTP